jgi:hypothetical protein
MILNFVHTQVLALQQIAIGAIAVVSEEWLHQSMKQTGLGAWRAKSPFSL